MPAPKTVAAAVVGVGGGYLIWLATTTAVVAVTPVRYWVVSVAILSTVPTLAAVAMAIRHKGTAKAIGFSLAPVLPILVSLYTLILLAT